VIGEHANMAPTELARALCAKLAECNGRELGALTQQECAAYFSMPCFFLSNLTAEDGLAECLASIRSLPCRSGDIVSETCATAFARARARETGLSVQTMEGGMCGDGIQCTGNMVCDGFSGECGTCVDGPRIGDPCEDGECWSGYCDDTTGLCMASKADGEACSDDRECDSLDCNATGLCKPFIDETFCTTDDDCGDERCVNGRCLEREPPGGACVNSGGCEEGACDQGVCKLVARCSLGEAGEPCGPGCSGNLQCENGVCVTPPTPGMPNGTQCATGADCASGHCSFIGAGTPVCASRGTNQPCDADDQCESGACVSFRCAGTALCAE
jgi:hypothetical protein